MAPQHPAERALTSDWFTNSFIMVVYEKSLLKLSQFFSVQSGTKKIFS